MGWVCSAYLRLTAPHRGYFLGYDGSVGRTDVDRRLSIDGGKNIPKEKRDDE